MHRAAIWIGGLVVLVAATAGLLWLATSGAAQFRVEGERLHISGQLTLASTERIDTLVEQTPGLTTVVLGEIAPDSDMTAILQKGALIRVLGLNTDIEDGVTLGLPGTYMFLGGVARRLGADQSLSAGDWMTNVGPASALSPEHSAHSERRGYVEQMLGDDAFYWFSLDAAPVDGARVLTALEIDTYGLVAP